MKWKVWAAACVAVAIATAAGCSSGVRQWMYSSATFDNFYYKPFKIAPGVYYIGSSGIAVFALESERKIAIVDVGYGWTAPRILENLRYLGFDKTDVKYILSTHAHFDHAAGIAWLQHETNAPVVASEDSRLLLKEGGADDEVFGNWFTYRPVPLEKIQPIYENEGPAGYVQIGAMKIKAHMTPGHAEGCTGWSFETAIDGKATQAYIDCSLTSAFYKFVKPKTREKMLIDYEVTFEKLRTIPCDLFLAPHAWMFDMDMKRERQKRLEAEDASTPNPFISPEGCKYYRTKMEYEFRKKLPR